MTHHEPHVNPIGFRYKVVKTYPKRGPLQQYRVESSIAFACFRCGRDKTSKLVTVVDNDSTLLLCNGCYGRLISVVEIKASSQPTDEKADQLLAFLTGSVTAEQTRTAERLLLASERRASLLDEKSIRLLATSDFVAYGMKGTTSLDWSAAIIGLCKAVEVEVGVRLIGPLRSACEGVDLTVDIEDKDLGRVAKFCAGRTDIFPELGVVRHSLQTMANSRQRAESSVLLSRLRKLMGGWPRSDWLLASDGAMHGLDKLTTDYRNPAPTPMSWPTPILPGVKSL